MGIELLDEFELGAGGEFHFGLEHVVVGHSHLNGIIGVPGFGGLERTDNTQVRDRFNNLSERESELGAGRNLANGLLARQRDEADALVGVGAGVEVAGHVECDGIVVAITGEVNDIGEDHVSGFDGGGSLAGRTLGIGVGHLVHIDVACQAEGHQREVGAESNGGAIGAIAEVGEVLLIGLCVGGVVHMNHDGNVVLSAVLEEPDVTVFAIGKVGHDGVHHVAAFQACNRGAGSTDALGASQCELGDVVVRGGKAVADVVRVNNEFQVVAFAGDVECVASSRQFFAVCVGKPACAVFEVLVLATEDGCPLVQVVGIHLIDGAVVHIGNRHKDATILADFHAFGSINPRVACINLIAHVFFLFPRKAAVVAVGAGSVLHEVELRVELVDTQPHAVGNAGVIVVAQHTSVALGVENAAEVLALGIVVDSQRIGSPNGQRTSCGILYISQCGGCFQRLSLGEDGPGDFLARGQAFERHGGAVLALGVLAVDGHFRHFLTVGIERDTHVHSVGIERLVQCHLGSIGRDCLAADVVSKRVLRTGHEGQGCKPGKK